MASSLAPLRTHVPSLFYPDSYTLKLLPPHNKMVKKRAAGSDKAQSSEQRDNRVSYAVIKEDQQALRVFPFGAWGHIGSFRMRICHGVEGCRLECIGEGDECEWAGIDPKLFSWEVTSLDKAMDQWTFNFADKDPDVIEARMTAKEKQAIIDYLGDWCLYKDWDSLVASFSPLAYLGRFQLLLTATVLKNIFESVVRNPFFYIDLGEDWDGSGSDRAANCIRCRAQGTLPKGPQSVCAWCPLLACINNQTLQQIPGVQ
ncbi:hypothetical protein PMG11_06302 [Penicillium brasilianum]|uniref:Uncharacterized protein n=1 Tax=Penicillium brasilianum TaxID=104259 RepID=A0A0F7TLV7_PENBI|nr:hypothetical protein PMG11_06302 [Penicillium brasilianum]